MCTPWIWQTLRRNSWPAAVLFSGETNQERPGAGPRSIVPAVLETISTRIFADGADLDGILAFASDSRISGFTTNPTLMWKAGLTDYAEFAKRLLERITKHPISFEVFADDVEEMTRQARIIASWGENVYVKIPVTTTKGEPLAPLARELSESGIKVNVTALFTTAQVELVTAAVKDGAPSFISVFAGRIADAGIDPVPIIARSVDIMVDAPRSELIWASPREVLNLVQADRVGCHIITMTHDLLKKLDCLGKNLEQYSLETVRMFHGDAVAAGFSL
jgi:transaldolase